MQRGRHRKAIMRVTRSRGTEPRSPKRYMTSKAYCVRRKDVRKVRTVLEGIGNLNLRKQKGHVVEDEEPIPAMGMRGRLISVHSSQFAI
ncbi:hypothetical protein Tco_0648878 [Tanacetum coccineum]